LIPVLSKALDVLELLQRSNQPQTLEQVYVQVNASKSTVYRVLKTLVHRGYLAQAPDGTYRAVSRPRKVTFGFGCQSKDMPFSQAVTEGLEAAAASAGIDLLVLDNCYNSATALRNADEFVRRKVDLVIEFQIDQQAAPAIADKINSAGIPVIAVDIPHPHATFFGVDNYRTGLAAGECLGQFALKEWHGRVRWILGLGLPDAGYLVQSRIAGAFDGIRSVLPGMPPSIFVSHDGKGRREVSYELVMDFLRRHPWDRGILIAAATDVSALGALQAVRELKRTAHVAIVGQDCIPEAEQEMRRLRSPLIGSVSHEARTYGPRLVQLGLALLGGQIVPPYNYVEHKLVLASSVRKSARANPGKSNDSWSQNDLLSMSSPTSSGDISPAGHIGRTTTSC
jgi:ribose transport system substrate-binding protein